MCNIYKNNKSKSEKNIKQKVTQGIIHHRHQKINQDIVFKEQNEDVNNLAVHQHIFQQIDQHLEQRINQNVK